ncbi:MAG: amidohydrolase family protein [Micromonosporaceae bacterium]|nr:amidohydrolase family protein [Micromonosporaceae bacterium]
MRRTAHNGRRSVGGVPTIDVHTHYVPYGWPDLAAVAGPAEDWPWLRIENEREAMIMVSSREFRPVRSSCWDAEVRLAEMAEDGVDVQVVSPTPLFFSYLRPAQQAMRVARVFNDLALDICAPAPDRLVPFCQVPLQDVDAAVAELDRCLANGHVGVEIGNHVGERDLDDGGIVAFLQHCAGRGAPVFVHPWDMPVSSRLDRWMARWLTGMPAETHLSILALILGGGFDKVSEKLRICFAHGGGSFPFWLDRVENAWHRRNDIVATSEKPPSQYLDRFYVDSGVHGQRPLRLLVDTMGADRVLLGTDYPYPLGERPAGHAVRESEWLGDDAMANILGGNAMRFLYGK